MLVPFNKTTSIEIDQLQFSSGFDYHQKKYLHLCQDLFQTSYPASRVFLTKSCTDALELSALVCGLKPGDEVILPSFGFVGTANAIANRGAKCIFVDIRKDTLNIDEQSIEQALTNNTRAIVTTNYAGVACNYDYILKLKKKHDFVLIEDNAQGIGGYYENKPLGTFGDLAGISFDSLKNISCGQGGCLLVNNESFHEAVKIAYEFGTNRIEFFEGRASQYEWKGLGSNFPIAEYLAAILFKQLGHLDEIIRTFLAHWEMYYQSFQLLSQKEFIDLPQIPSDCRHNGHIFHLRTREVKNRDLLISFLKKKGIAAYFHYTPLHLSEFGKKHSEFRGNDNNTRHESSRLVRLPMYYSLTENEQAYVIESVFEYFGIKTSASHLAHSHATR